MQILIQVVCSKGKSLRQLIIDDKNIEEFQLVVSQEKRHNRAPGWAKIHSTQYDRHGAINIEWGSKINVLSCRVVTRGSGKPNLIVGDFINYLLHRFVLRRRSRVITINIVPLYK